MGFCVYVATISCNALISLFPEISNDKCHKSGCVLFCGAKLTTFTIALLPMVGFQIRKMQMYVGEFLTKVACSSVLPDTVKCICQMYFKYAQFNGTGLQCRVVSHVGLGGSGLAGQKLGKFVEGWTRDTQDSEGRTLGCPGGGHQTEETCQLTLGSGDTKLKRHVKQGHLTLCFKVLRRLPKNHGVFTLVSTFPCETNNADRELLAGNYIFTQSKKCKCKCIAQNFSTNQQPLSILKLVCVWCPFDFVQHIYITYM